MREALRLLDRLESAAMAEMVPLYVQAITSTDAEKHWGDFREVFVRAYVLANLIGRLDIQNSAIRAGARRSYADSLITAPWDKAIKIFLAKVPMAKSLLHMLLPVARAKAFYVTGIESTQALTKIKERISQTLGGENPENSSLDDLEALTAEKLSRFRLETVLRTNTMTAMNEGAMDETRLLGNSVALLMLNEVHDQRTRGNPNGLYPDSGPHYQMDGFVESPSHPIWATIRPPNGFNCRGNISVIGWLKCESMGLGSAKTRTLDAKAVAAYNGKRWDYILSGKYPDGGFGGSKSSAVAA